MIDSYVLLKGSFQSHQSWLVLVNTPQLINSITKSKVFTHLHIETNAFNTFLTGFIYLDAGIGIDDDKVILGTGSSLSAGLLPEHHIVGLHISEHVPRAFSTNIFNKFLSMCIRLIDFVLTFHEILLLNIHLLIAE